MIKPTRALCATVIVCGLSGCMDADVTRAADTPARSAVVDPIGPLSNPATVDAAAETCLAETTTPALIETVTEQIVVPETLDANGQVLTPATVSTRTRQDILRERRDVEFEIPCAVIVTPPFIASVQRALIARGYYDGPINGQLDAKTSAAVGRYQIAQNDVHTDILTLQTARSLGLVAVPRDAS